MTENSTNFSTPAGIEDSKSVSRLAVAGAALLPLVVAGIVFASGGNAADSSSTEPVGVATPSSVTSPAVSPAPTLPASPSLPSAPPPASVTATDPGSLAGPPQDVANGISATVQRVIDGDTVVLTNGERVRLIGFDTPECIDRDGIHCLSWQCGFQEAKELVASLVEGREVVLIGNPLGDEFDRFDRRLAFINVDGVDIGSEVVKSGWGQPRYNSTDGYAWHLNEDWYFDLAQAAPSRC